MMTTLTLSELVAELSDVFDVSNVQALVIVDDLSYTEELDDLDV